MSVYFITLIEGILTFISPCILPIIPVYISFLSSGVGKDKRKIMINALGFVFGFSFVFILLGISATTLGRFFIKYSKYYNIVAGAIIVLFGLNFSGLINIAFLNKTLKPNLNNDVSKKLLYLLLSYLALFLE